MKGTRLSGKSFDVQIGDLLIHVDEAGLDIEDNRTIVKNKGIPNGHVDGDVSASGEIKVDTANFNKISEVAKKAGSWRGMAEFDIAFVGETARESLSVEAFGCVLKISSVLDIKAEGGEKTMHVLPYEVSSPDFVSINGVPYLDKAETEGF